MGINCDIDDSSLQCSRCGARFVHARVVSQCPGRRSPGLGDRVASALDSVGITKERVEALVGGPCGCSGRQAALNAAGAKWLGLSPGSTTSTPDASTNQS